VRQAGGLWVLQAIGHRNSLSDNKSTHLLRKSNATTHL
jgi:hypothetical protein